MAGTITFAEVATGKVLVTRMIDHEGAHIARRKAETALIENRRAAIAKVFADKGQYVTSMVVTERAEGKYVQMETGVRYAIVTKGRTPATPTANREYGENLTEDARRLKYGR